MFPGAGATIYRNEAGEVLGWSDESSYEPEPYDDDRGYAPEDGADDDPAEYVAGDGTKKCPHCGDTRLHYNPRPTGRYDEGDLWVCQGCEAEGETDELEG